MRGGEGQCIYGVIFCKAFRRDNRAKESGGVKRRVSELYSPQQHFFALPEVPRKRRVRECGAGERSKIPRSFVSAVQ